MSAQTEGRGRQRPRLSVANRAHLAMDLDWMDQALCKGEDTGLFYPELLDGPGRYSTEHLAQITKAKEICARCPVRNVCLDYAMRNKERYGIWGGLLPYERFPRRRRKSA